MGKRFVVGTPVRVLGAGYDLTTGSVSDDDIVWSHDTLGVLASGADAELDLPAGTHAITLGVTAESGLVGTDAVTIVVDPDLDEDGMSDLIEASHPCLSASQHDSDADPDFDGWASYGEIESGTDPCNPDTDGDGSLDGDELWFGTNPDDASDSFTLAPDHLAVAPPLVEFSCSSPDSAVVLVDAPAGDEWTIIEAATWLNVSPSSGSGSSSVELDIDCSEILSGSDLLDVVVAPNERPSADRHGVHHDPRHGCGRHPGRGRQLSGLSLPRSGQHRSELHRVGTDEGVR